MKMRKFINNKYGSGFGTLLIIAPFIFCAILTFIGYSFIPDGDYSSVFGETGKLMMETPEDYFDMNKSERQDYFFNLHGGLAEAGLGHEYWTNPTWDIHLRFWGLYDFNYHFNDSTSVWGNDLQTYIDGEIFEPTYGSVTQNILFLNPPLIDKMGMGSTLLRMILIASVAVGLTEILWIG